MGREDPHLRSEELGQGGGAPDSQGRRWIQGPTIYGVELITMLSIAMPIGILGILKSKTRSRKILYGLGIVILIAAMFATNALLVLKRAITSSRGT